ncbi:hypothetical protein M9H77_12753 [Catharanthus roseus]|uniref:Uncharacterized protein n=1 Tax=Catharanthus roseus TaxID=4058 RepID=A0ACC0BIE3_CATRO|nr:hypothetical protein M9H77_12753 [Catharanthus roseus]
MSDLISFLPPGFHFNPTDEQLISYFLYPKSSNLPCNPNIIPHLDFSSSDPWNLTERAFLSKNQYYFFSRLIDNRATEKGHWQEHDHVDQTIFSSSSGKKVGIKKYLLFIVDKAPNKIKTSWVMEEYHLSKNGLFGRNYKRGRNQAQEVFEWVLCRVHDANTDSQFTNNLQSGRNGDDEHEDELSFMDEVFLSMADDDDQDEIISPD